MLQTKSFCEDYGRSCLSSTASGESTRPPGGNDLRSGGGALVVSEGPDEEGGEGAGQQVPLTPAPPGRTNSVTGLRVQPVGDDVMGSYWSQLTINVTLVNQPQCKAY
jgi:hypothetical protein